MLFAIGQLGADLLLVLWVCAILAVGLAKVEGVDGEVSVAVHGPSLYVLVSKMLQGLLFQVMKNLYLIWTYKAVVHQILGSYVGLCRDPKFLQDLDVFQQSWDP